MLLTFPEPTADLRSKSNIQSAQRLLRSFESNDIPQFVDKSWSLLVVPYRHSRWGFHGFRGDELVWVVLEPLDSIDKSGAVDRLGSVLRRGRRVPLLEKIADM
jgi:hypothetical protein